MLVVSATMVERICVVLKMVFLTKFYQKIQRHPTSLGKSLDGNLEPEIKSRIIGVKSHMTIFDYFYGVTILQLVLKTRWQFIENTSKVFSYFLLDKRNCWFDTADNKFTPIRKWIWITLTENGTTSRGIRNNSTISFT